MIIEYVEARRNLNMKAIEVIEEVDREVLETRIIRPNKLILSTKHFIQQTKEALKIEVITPICDGEIDLEKMQLRK
jgi:hypothetical protein